MKLKNALRILAIQLCREQGLLPTSRNMVRVLVDLPPRTRNLWEKKDDQRPRRH